MHPDEHNIINPSFHLNSKRPIPTPFANPIQRYPHQASSPHSLHRLRFCEQRRKKKQHKCHHNRQHTRQRIPNPNLITVFVSFPFSPYLPPSSPHLTPQIIGKKRANSQTNPRPPLPPLNPPPHPRTRHRHPRIPIDHHRLDHQAHDQHPRAQHVHVPGDAVRIRPHGFLEAESWVAG